MDIKINEVHFDADQKLIDFVELKINKLANKIDGIVRAEVFLTFDKSKSKHTENKVVKIKLEVPGHDLFAEKEATTFEDAVDQSIDALKRQIEKHKAKTR